MLGLYRADLLSQAAMLSKQLDIQNPLEFCACEEEEEEEENGW
jgi:hypothetical protein